MRSIPGHGTRAGTRVRRRVVALADQVTGGHGRRCPALVVPEIPEPVVVPTHGAALAVPADIFLERERIKRQTIANRRLQHHAQAA